MTSWRDRVVRAGESSPGSACRREIATRCVPLSFRDELETSERCLVLFEADPYSNSDRCSCRVRFNRIDR